VIFPGGTRSFSDNGEVWKQAKALGTEEADKIGSGLLGECTRRNKWRIWASVWGAAL